MRLLAVLLSCGITALGQGGVFPPPSGGGGGGTGDIDAVTAGAGLAGGGSSGSVTLRLSQAVNSQTGTTYTYQNTDCGKLVVHSNAGAIAGTLPQAGGGGNFAAGCVIEIMNLGPGTLTVTPSTSTVNGGASLVFLAKQVARVDSDGANYSAGAGQNATQLAGVTPGAGGLAILDDANAAAIQSTLGLVPGTNVQAFDSDLTTYASITPSANVQSILGAANYSAIRTLLSLVPGTNVQAEDADLDALAALSATAGMLSRTGAGAFAVRTLTAPASGITISNGTGAAGNPTLALANDLAGVEGLASNGIPARTATDTWAVRTITGTGGEITITNGDGVSGNPTAALAAAFDISGHTSTAPVKSGTAAPGTCTVGQLFYDTDATAGQNLYGCTTLNTWTLLGDGGGGGGSGTVNTGAAGCVAYYPSAATTVDDAQNSANCALKFDSTNNRLEFYDTSNTLTIRIDATAGTIETFGAASETIMTDLGADPSAPSSGKTSFYTKSGKPMYIPSGGSGTNLAIGNSAGAANSVASGAALTNVTNNVSSSLGTSTGAGLYIPGTSLTAGSLYYQASGGLTAADADSSSSMPAVCLAISTTQCAFSGVYRFGSSQGWTVGNILYTSGTAGALTATAPSTSGQQVQRVGVALAADTILVMPSLDVGGVQ